MLGVLLELYRLLHSADYQIPTVIEIWLKSGIPHSTLDPENLFHIFRHDRHTNISDGI